MANTDDIEAAFGRSESDVDAFDEPEQTLVEVDQALAGQQALSEVIHRHR